MDDADDDGSNRNAYDFVELVDDYRIASTVSSSNSAVDRARNSSLVSDTYYSLRCNHFVSCSVALELYTDTSAVNNLE